MGKTNQISIERRIVDFYNDPLFQELNAFYSKKTLFNILKIERNENRHSAFLAWLLDERGSHGLGEEPLKKFMRLLAMKNNECNEPFLVGNYCVDKMRVDIEKSIENNKRRMDVYISLNYSLNYSNTNGKSSKHEARIIIENKIFSEEKNNQTQDYYKWAKKDKDNRKAKIIGVFLSPDSNKPCSCKDFIKITYDDILTYVIEPLLEFKMPDEAKMLLTDYVINLGQPLKVKKDDNGERELKEDTILALSRKNKDKFVSLYENHAQLLNAAMYYAYGIKKKRKDLLGSLFTEKDELQKIEEFLSDKKELLDGLWKSNERLLRMILDTALKIRYEDKSQEISELLNIKENNRQKFTFNGVTYDIKGKLCHAIVKFYVEQNQNVTVDDLQRTFSTKVKNNDKIVATIDEAKKTQDSSGKVGGNYYMKESDRIRVKDNDVVVWNYWPDRFFVPFMDCVRSLNIVVEEIE